MFEDTDDGQTQYCPSCLEWSEKYKKLEAENEELKKAKDEYYLNNLSYEIKLSELIQTLEEIRELANKRNVGCGKFCEVNRKEHNCNAECNAYYLKQIKDKINEVLEDEIHN